jgi:hypothetical protein
MLSSSSLPFRNIMHHHHVTHQERRKDMNDHPSPALGFAVAMLTLAWIVSFCLGQPGPGCACLLAWVIALAAASHRPQPPRRRISRHYW